MKKLFKSIIGILAIAGLTGCTSMHMFNNPTADMSRLPQGEIQENVGLYVTPELSEYVYEDTCGAEMSNVRYNLGTATVLLFEDVLAQVTKGVKVVSGKPPYKGKLQHIALVIEPSIVNFSQKNPFLTRVGKYSAEITYDVKVYNSSGKLVLEKKYTGSGAKNGIATKSPGHNYEIAAGLAMKDAVSQVVKDIEEIAGQ